MTRQSLAMLLSLMALSACRVGPSYQKPDIAVPSQFGAIPADQAAAPLSQPQATSADLSEWWRQFHDPELERLVERALQANLSLQSAESRIRQAREQVIVAGASRLPSVGSSAAAVRLHTNSDPLAALGGQSSSGAQSGNGGQSGSGSGSTSGSTLQLYSVGFDATWELDLFGGAARGVEAAKANAEAALWQLRDTQVSLTAEIAVDYLTLRMTQARTMILQQSAAHQRELLQLTAARWHAGFVTELDVNQQRGQLAATMAQIPELQAEEQAQVHALGVLLAGDPDSLAAELAPSSVTPAVPAELPVGLPSELLRRRPDVRRAERQLAAATAQVGVAVADLYPKFDLLGAVSLFSPSARTVFEGNSLATAAGGLISWPVFQGGRLRANVRVNEEQRQQDYLAYRQSVLTALRDTEDSLTRYVAEQRRLVALRESQQAAVSSQKIAEEQYRVGTVTFINVLTATTARLNADDQVAQSTQALAQDVVSIYKALGGGWRGG